MSFKLKNSHLINVLLHNTAREDDIPIILKDHVDCSEMTIDDVNELCSVTDVMRNKELRNSVFMWAAQTRAQLHKRA